MGGAPIWLATRLQAELALDRAVETGTFLGAGAKALSRVFPEVVTVELSEELHAQAVASHGSNPKIRFVHGDSRRVLAELADATIPSFYFLDGHWSGGPTTGTEAQCPLLDELAALVKGHPRDCIVIDDARLFLAAPPPPYRPDDWPTLVQVIDAIQAGHARHHITVLDDQVIAVPPEAKATVDWMGQRWARVRTREVVRRVLGSHLPAWSPVRQAVRGARLRLAEWRT